MNGKEEHTRLMGKVLMIIMSMMAVMAAMMLARAQTHTHNTHARTHTLCVNWASWG